VHPAFSIANWLAAVLAYAVASRRTRLALRPPLIVLAASVVIFAVHAGVMFAIDGPPPSGWTGLGDEQLLMLGVLGGAANAAAHSAFAQVASKKLDMDVALTLLVTESLWMFVPFAGWRRLSVLVVIGAAGVFAWIRGTSAPVDETDAARRS
jgi:hypothetical protein